MTAVRLSTVANELVNDKRKAAMNSDGRHVVKEDAEAEQTERPVVVFWSCIKLQNNVIMFVNAVKLYAKQFTK